MDERYVTRDDFDAAIIKQIIGLSVLGTVLLIFVVLASIAIGFLVLKLRELHHELTRVMRDHEKHEEPIKRRSEKTHDATLPALELVIERETVNLYGCKPMLSQVMMAAQSFHKEHSNTTLDCPAELVQVVNKKSDQRFARSTVYTDDWMEGAPTSFLLQGSARSFEDVLGHNKGLFVHKRIGPTGGQLCVSGVKLVIPAGAMSEEMLITVGITWDERYHPTLAARQALLSPVVLCQPSGLRFLVPVTLSFPHAAYNVQSDWMTTIQERTGDLQGDSVWAELQDPAECHMMDTCVELRLRHFTLYTCTGTAAPGAMAAKLVHVVAFTGSLERNAFFKPRFYCINSYKEEMQDVENLEKKLNPYSHLAETAPLMVKDNGNDVIVELSKLSEKWTLAGDKQERLPFELVWHACQPHCTFVLKPETLSVSEIVCEIQTYQSGNDNNYNKFKIAQKVTPPSSPLSAEPDPMADLINTLVILLDPCSDVGSDWRRMAEKMGCDFARIRWLSSSTLSPTRVLIDRWLEDKKPLQDLMDMMVAIERDDAAEEIKKRMPHIEV